MLSRLETFKNRGLSFWCGQQKQSFRKMVTSQLLMQSLVVSWGPLKYAHETVGTSFNICFLFSSRDGGALRRMTFYSVLVCLVYFIQANYFKKYLAENAVNTISETLVFKIFWGRMPPDPPTNLRLWRSFSAPPTSKYAPLSLSSVDTVLFIHFQDRKM